MNNYIMIVLVWFTLEYGIRLICSPNKCHFVFEALNLIDIAAILPFYVTEGVQLILGGMEMTHLSEIRRFLQILRVLRILRVLKLARHSTGLKAVGFTIQKSYRELGMLCFFLGIGVITFSSLIYYAEKDENGAVYQSIPGSFWWCIITMTTYSFVNICK